MSRDERLGEAAARFGIDLDSEIKVGGHYVPLVRHGDLAYVSGQIPRIGDVVVVTGAVGADVTLAQARIGASICIMRALVLLKSALVSLDGIDRIIRMTVFVQSAPSFTQHSEVADAASDLLVDILGAAGAHVRTSVGVVQLPKSASVEIELTASVR
jgi:enamine deaminase RidA (YjgF/YER057c/UK114 family)